MRKFAASLFLCAVTADAAEVSFNREVRPILAEACFECHGPSKARGDLRLDVPEHGSLKELLRRARSKDPEEQMPPPKSGKAALPEKQIEVLERWIANGAKWDRPWAFKRVERPALPRSDETNPIDALREKVGEKASERILRRRLAFDLTGLPPSEEDSNWERLVNKYLASPAFGERMAVWWLDLVRYADSEGYFYDYSRNVYPYRDYVIRVFNSNKRFDRFTMEQIAGDLLPGAGWEEKIASGYNRLVMTTQENGANAADYRARYAADRVKNLSTVWLGLTLGCAQCHDHKSDPISTVEFYRTAAFFADVKEEATAKQEEVLVVERSAEYAGLLEKTTALRRILAAGPAAIACAQIEELESGRAPDYWPKSKKTDWVADLIQKSSRTAEEDETVAAYFSRHYIVKLNRDLGELDRARARFEKEAPRTLITESGRVRTVRVLARGNWMDEESPQVRAGFLSALGAGCEDQSMSRLDLAQWLVARENPLTARVLANRLWQLFFGLGIVRTLDDFGAQGLAPSNPDLLDWLAAELMESGWDIKHLVHLIVTSRAYQEKSSTENRWVMQAEFLRDNTLSVAGLLSTNSGGPPIVMPSQTDSLVGSLKDEGAREGSGEEIHRRTIYFQRKRASLHPALAAFNASSREECVSAPPRSRTPSEALALLNAPEFIEAARAFAERIKKGADNDEGRIQAAFQVALNRAASKDETNVLLELQKTGGWIDVARAILNLEEMHTRY